MSDPVRLFDASDSALERQLLGVARSEKSSPDARAKTLAALGITGSAAFSAAAVGAMATRASIAAGKSAWAKLILGLSALGAVAIAPPAYRAWQRHVAAGAPATVALVAALSPATPPAAPNLGAPALGNPAPVVAATLARELAALDAARTAVAHEEPRRALALLDGYARAYPDGSLGPEAEILRIDALAQGGHGAAARHRARAFVRRHPSSVLAARARQYLAD
jgi:hypothetical protein